MKRSALSSLVLLALLLAAAPAGAALLSDLRFDGDGRLQVRPGPDELSLVFAYPSQDGRTTVFARERPRVTGARNLVAVRYFRNGERDHTFSAHGTRRISFPGQVRSAAVVRDMRGFVVATSFTPLSSPGPTHLGFALVRWNGTIARAPGTSGMHVAPLGRDVGRVVDVALTPGRRVRVLCVGPSGWTIYGLHMDGGLDTSFGVGGVLELRRFDDPAGAPSGFVGPWRFNAMRIDAYGRMLLAGAAGDDGVVARLLEDGSPDPAYGDGRLGPGIARPALGSNASTTFETLDLQGSLREQALVGSSAGTRTRRFLLARLTPTGMLDSAFGSGDGYVKTAIVERGRHTLTDVGAGRSGIGVTGSVETPGERFRLALARYTTDGRLRPGSRTIVPAWGRVFRGELGRVSSRRTVVAFDSFPARGGLIQPLRLTLASFLMPNSPR